MDELTQADLEAAHPLWVFGYTINNRPKAHRPQASPPVWLWGEDWADVHDQMHAAIAKRPTLDIPGYE